MSDVVMETVKMGELRVTNARDGELSVIGLGSCIGLALTDAQTGVAGLAHVVLPAAPDGVDVSAAPAKYADSAVPALVAAMVGVGARRRRLRAVVVGGAQMFPTGLDIGARNASAISRALAEAGIPLQASDLGGTRGRTIRVATGGRISSQTAGGTLRVLDGPDLTVVAA